MSYKVNLSERKMRHMILELDEQIKKCLNSTNIDVDRCLELLEELDQIPITADVLRKEPDVVVTIRKIRKFKADEDIRKRSNDLYEKFRSLIFEDISDTFSKTLELEENGKYDEEYQEKPEKPSTKESE